MKIKLQKFSCMIKNAVCLKAPAFLTTGLFSLGISSINKIPSQSVSSNKSYSSGLLLPDSSLISATQTCFIFYQQY